MFVKNGRLPYNGSGAAGGPAIPNIGSHPDFIDESAKIREQLDSWKEIASHLKRSVRTVTRWEREQGLPVHRYTTGTVYAYKSELDGWWLSRGQQIEREPPAKTLPRASKLKSAQIHVLAATTGVLLAAIIGWLTFRSNPKPAPKLLPLTTYPGIEGPPSLSPDGIYVMPLAGGQPRRITNDTASQNGLTWTPDGKEIVFSSDRTGSPRLWRISPNSSGKLPSPVESAGENAEFPSFSHPGAGMPVRLAYQRFDQNVNLRRAGIVGEGTPQHALKPSSAFAPTTTLETEPQFSPDGRKIAFISNRTGPWEIWLCDSDGSNLVRLTSFGGPSVGGPRWSPLGGRRITFFARTGALGEFQIYVMNAAGGSPRRLSRDDGQKDFRPAWSRDGRWIYFGSTRSGTIQIWKMPADGGPPVQVTKGGGGEPLESPDGVTLYYTNVPEVGPGLWSIPTGGGAEVRVLDSVRFGHWAVTSKGIYFIDFNAANDAPRPVKFFSLQSHRIRQVVMQAAEHGSLYHAVPDRQPVSVLVGLGPVRYGLRQTRA